MVVRPRLLAMLSHPRRVTVVAAPGGFGKTTLVRAWVDDLPAGHRSVVWVPFSVDVASRHDFWQLVVTSAVRAGAITADEQRALLGAIEVLDDPVPTIARVLGDRDGGGRRLLVLDGYERLRDVTAVVDDDLLRIASADDGVDVVVTTRAPTRLSDEALVAGGSAHVIGEVDLRFDVHETEELLALHVPHAVDRASDIVRDTGGYPLGVRAAAYALERRGEALRFDDAAWRRLVTEDLRSDIANPAMFGFVCDTSVPPYFDRDLAQRLAGTGDVDAILAELEWNGFGRWIPYAREQPVFQYVESVRDILLGQLRSEQPERYQRAAGLSAAWLHRHGDHHLALPLAIDGGELALASSICRILSVSNPDSFTTEEARQLLLRVPRALLSRHPVLAFVRGMAFAANTATQPAAPEYLRIAGEHALDHTDELAPAEIFSQHIMRVMCFHFLGLGREARVAADEGSTFLDSMPAADRAALGESLPLWSAILAYSLFQGGDVDRAGAMVNGAVASAVDPFSRDFTLAFVVAIHALNGRCSEARAALAMAEPGAWAAEGRRRLSRALGVTGQAVLRLDEFDLTGALHAFDGTEWFLDVAESWPFITWVVMHARLGLGEARSEARRVERALTANPWRPGVGSNLGTAALLNELAILWIADGNVAKARPLLGTPTDCPGQFAPAKLLTQLVTGDPTGVVRSVSRLQAERGHTVRSAAAADTLGAAAAMRCGNERTALELLERAASSHHRFGVRAHLMYLPLADLTALRDLARAASSAVSEDYLGPEVTSVIRSTVSVPVRLTPREVDVLAMWARCRTRAEAAAALFVSEHTVRSQLNSVYRKLDVTTKDAAIQRAIELDLFAPPQL